MSFQEKTLWVSMVAVTAILGSYLFDVGRLMADHMVDAGQAYGGFIRSVVMLAIVQTVATIVLASLSPDDANAPRDARDRDFAATAAVPAYALLCTLIAIVMLAIPAIIRFAPRYLIGDAATVNAVVIGNALLLALVIAHVVHCAAQIHRYRREG